MDKRSLRNLLPLFLSVLLLTIAFIPSIRSYFAHFIDVFLGPFIERFGLPFYIIIMYLSIFAAVTTALIQKYTIDCDLVDSNKERMRAFQSRYWEMMKSNDTEQLQEMERMHRELSKEQLSVTINQLRPIGYILLVTLPVFFWLVYKLPEASGKINLPFFNVMYLTDPILGPLPVWFMWYLICSFSVSYAIRSIFNVKV
jgi:uncharacterized membrane protein (DUF106 family)